MYENIAILYDGFSSSMIADILMYGMDSSNPFAAGSAIEMLGARGEHDLIYDVVMSYEYDLGSSLTRVVSSALVKLREDDPVLGLLGQAIAHAILDNEAERRNRDYFDPSADFSLPIDIITCLPEDATPAEAEGLLSDLVANLAEQGCLDERFDEDSRRIALALIREGATTMEFVWEEYSSTQTEDDKEGSDFPEYYND
ncbi:hypothetical protein IJG04_02025 [Candidatus Saccharibacteria bacterium]|nr:hypothetical protein [Candidatus Saccharibacteria bacterium]